ncbi:MAG: phytanoyl-CoA dioxygenase family protein [Microthrixaceae bacterium]
MPTRRADDAAPAQVGQAEAVIGELSDQGFTSRPFLGASVVDQLLELVAELDLAPDHDFFASSNDLDGAAAQRVAARITSLVTPALADLLPDHDLFLASVLTKGRGPGSRVSFHQDLTYTDERHHRATLLWVPLCDVDARNGALAVIPGSHRWTDGCRPGGLDPLPTEPHQDTLARLARVVPLRAGDALLYDAATVHGSGINTGTEPRPAIGLATVPRGAELVHVHRDDDGVTAWTVDPSFYTLQSLWHRPAGQIERAPWADPVSEEHIARALQPADAVDRPTGPPARALRRREDDDTLRYDGWTVVDLPAASTVAGRLRGFHGHHRGLHGEGFEPDLVNPDLDYRSRVSAELASALDDVVDELFVDHEPFLRVFLAKWPGPESGLYLHRDWMYVDERRWGHTFVVWIPLCDVDDRNGPLQVLRGSHRIDDSLRGTDLNAPWINLGDVIAPRLETVTARLGQAVIMDNALVHSSLPNESGDLRLVAAIGMRPRGAPLVHFVRGDDDAAWRFDVDDGFLMHTTPQGLLEAPPDLPVVEQLPASQRFWTESELLDALGDVPEVDSEPTAPDARVATWWERLRRRMGVL